MPLRLLQSLSKLASYFFQPSPNIPIWRVDGICISSLWYEINGRPGGLPLY